MKSQANSRSCRLVMTLVCRNEDDILEPLLQYHLRQGVDHIIATDNASTDGSVDILLNYQQMGVLTLLHEPAVMFAQGRWVTRMARLAVDRHAADWVINTDADEFWWPLSGTLNEALSNVRQEAEALSVVRYNFVPIISDLDQPFWKRMVYREVRSYNLIGVPLPSKVCHRGFADVQIAEGNHSVRRVTKSIATEAADSLVIFHFPMRTAGQFESKIRLGAEALERNPDLPSEIGATWRHMYHKYPEPGQLCAYFKEHSLSEQQIARAIDDGRVVPDRRLCRLMESTEGIAITEGNESQ